MGRVRTGGDGVVEFLSPVSGLTPTMPFQPDADKNGSRYWAPALPSNLNGLRFGSNMTRFDALMSYARRLARQLPKNRVIVYGYQHATDGEYQWDYAVSIKPAPPGNKW